VNRARAALEVTRASLAQRQAELENAKADIRRAQNLHEQKLIARQEFESRQTAFRVVEAQVQFTRAQERQAQAELNELQIRLAQSKIYAPMAGVIARRYVDVGALVNPSNPIVNLVNLSTMVTMANVPEREIGKLRVGTRALVHVDAFGEQRFTGRIARIAPVLDPATRTATVEVEIPNPTGGLKAEMFARVTLDLATQRQAVLIPREALVYRGQQAGVYVMQDKRPIFRTIETGLTRGDDVEVLANLQPGATIVTRGATMLNEGDQVRIAPMSERKTAADTSSASTKTRP
jgi:HlyD family secretion protein